MTWVLLLMVHVGSFGKYEATAVTSTPGFTSRAQCEAAGRAAAQTFTVGVKQALWVCAEQGAK